MSASVPSGRSVCFARSFRCESADNISHFVPDGSERTLCGREGWAVDDGPASIYPDCLRCSASLARLRAQVVAEVRS